MAIRFLIGRGIGFNPQSVRYICTDGMALVPVTPSPPPNACIATMGFGLNPRIANMGYGVTANPFIFELLSGARLAGSFGAGRLADR